MDKLDLMKRADDLLKFILEGLEQGKEFASEQAPIVVKEVITWGIINGAVGVAAGCIALLFAAYCVRRIEDDAEWIIGAIFGSMIGAFAVLINLFPMLKAIYAPRLYLLDQLKSLLH